MSVELLPMCYSPTTINYSRFRCEYFPTDPPPVRRAVFRMTSATIIHTLCYVWIVTYRSFEEVSKKIRQTIYNS